MKKTNLLFLLCISVLLFGCTSREEDRADSAVGTGDAARLTQEGVAGEQEAKTYTLADVAAHASQEDCWLAIHGKVYDVTHYIKSHPGGTAILQGCGNDATYLFEVRPMGSGLPHSDIARHVMQKYYIGDVGGQ
jgi:cytochrome b involved in lipid metabolism